MNNIVFVNFECNESTKVVAQKIWQYDYGQILRIQGLNLPAAVEIHFSLQKTGGVAKRRIGVTRDGVTDVVIPDFILTGEGIERNYSAYAFIYLSDEESGQTEHRIELNIKSRPEPEGSTGSNETSFGAIMDALKTFAAGKADGLKYENSILKLMSGEAELARVTIKAGEGTGSDAREIELQKSDTAIQWRYVGDEEWTDLVLLEELKGEKGDPGEGGKTAYQYAQDGGYTGTEEEFAKKLAQENPTREEFSQLSDTVNNQREDIANKELSGTATTKVSEHNISEESHSDIRLLISNLSNLVTSLLDSDDETLNQTSEIVTYIKSNKSLIDAITTSKVSVSDIIDNLTTSVSNKPLSAKQGVVLKGLIDAIDLSKYALKTELPSVPTTLPNPKALTFTGAVTGKYDGSEELTLDIPSGGGSSGENSGLLDELTLIEEITVEESVQFIYRDINYDMYKSIAFSIKQHTNGTHTIYIGCTAGGDANFVSNLKIYNQATGLVYPLAKNAVFASWNTGKGIISQLSSDANNAEGVAFFTINITGIRFYNNDNWQVGDVIKIYGEVR